MSENHLFLKIQEVMQKHHLNAYQVKKMWDIIFMLMRGKKVAVICPSRKSGLYAVYEATKEIIPLFTGLSVKNLQYKERGTENDKKDDTR